jgi:hypothetical protein
MSNPWRDKKARPLRDAAQAACEIAAAEHLPIDAALGADALRWHAEAMLKTIPVSGLQDGMAAVDGGPDGWRGLTVERHDFDAYLAWLRTVW